MQIVSHEDAWAVRARSRIQGRRGSRKEFFIDIVHRRARDELKASIVHHKQLVHSLFRRDVEMLPIRCHANRRPIV